MSLKTDNFKLYKYEDNDIGDLRFINDSMDIIDKGINPFYVATLDSTNVYKVTTGLNKTSLANGYSIKVAIPSNSTGAVSITVDNVTVPVKKPNGNAVTNFKQNGVYSLTYYNSVFILASGGGADTVNFTSDKLLTGYSANDSNGEKVNGTMPNKGTVTQSLSANGSLTLPRGYYDSVKISQSLTTKGATTWTPKTTNQTIASGTYLTGTQTIKGDSNLIASNIISGKSIFGVAGTANKYKTVTVSITGDATVTVPSDGTRLIACFASSTGGTIHGSACGFISFKISNTSYMNFLVRYKENSTTTALEPYTTNSTGAITSCKLYAGRNGGTFTRTAYIIYE